MSYIYRRTDNDELIEVEFSTMMEQRDGFITLPDGVLAKRCVGLEVQKHVESVRREHCPGGKPVPIVSDSLGFPQHQLADFERDRAKHGFTDVEFTRDPNVPEFYQVRIGSRAEWNRYIAHRGMVERNGTNGGGATLTAEQFKRTAELVERSLSEKFPQIPVLTPVAS